MPKGGHNHNHFTTTFEFIVSGESFKTKKEFQDSAVRHLWDDRLSITANGEALKDVLGNLMNIPRPHTCVSTFTWYGDIARSVLQYLLPTYETET